MKAGWVFNSLTLPMASRSVPSASGLAGLLKPIWLSLICAKVKPEPSAANASPSRPKDFGTPPDTVHKTPVPAQIMHSRAPRRFDLGSADFAPCLVTCCHDRERLRMYHASPLFAAQCLDGQPSDGETAYPRKTHTTPKTSIRRNSFRAYPRSLNV